MTKFLRRYTNIPALIYLLREAKITLLNSDNWDDKNDLHYMTLYLRKNHLSLYWLYVSPKPPDLPSLASTRRWAKWSLHSL